MEDTISRTQKKRLFVDMDGTLAVFTPTNKLEVLYEEKYFLNLEPMEDMVQAIKKIILEEPQIEVYVLSAYLTDSAHALKEKQLWLDHHLPEIPQNRRIFLPCGEDKKAYIPGGVRETDCLLDDYTKNLLQWHPPGKGIKVLNGINDTKGTWQHDRIWHKKNPEKLAGDIVSVVTDCPKIEKKTPVKDDSIGLEVKTSSPIQRTRGI